MCDAHYMYGTSVLWRSWIQKLRTPPGAATDDIVSLSSLRKSRGLSQAQLARRLGITQSDVSKLERRPDVRLSTLRAAVEAIGATLRIEAEFPDGTVARLAIGRRPEREGGIAPVR